MYEFSESFKCLKKWAGNSGSLSFFFKPGILKALKASLTTSHGYRFKSIALKVHSTGLSYNINYIIINNITLIILTLIIN